MTDQPVLDALELPTGAEQDLSVDLGCLVAGGECGRPGVHEVVCVIGMLVSHEKADASR